MQRPNTRSGQEQKKPTLRGAKGIQGTTSKNRVSVSASDLNLSATSGRGRGRTPIAQRPSSASSSLSVQSSTSRRAVRTSSVPRSLESYSQGADSFGVEANQVTFETLLTDCPDNLNRISPPRTERESVTMATGGSDTPPLQGSATDNNAMDSLIAYVREVLRDTQEKFRREIEGIRRNLNQPHDAGGANGSSRAQSQNSVPVSNATSNAVFIKLKDWNVSFSGDEDVNDFLFKVDTLTERSQCPLDHLMANFHIFLKGKAENWFWTYIRQNPRRR